MSRCVHLGAAPLTCAEGRTRAATLLIAFRPTRAGVAPLAVRQGEVSDLAPAHVPGRGRPARGPGLGRVLVGTPHSMQKSVERSLLNVPSPEPTDLFYLSSPHNPRQIEKITCVEGSCAARACCAESGAAFGCLWLPLAHRVGTSGAGGCFRGHVARKANKKFPFGPRYRDI